MDLKECFMKLKQCCFNSDENKSNKNEEDMESEDYQELIEKLIQDENYDKAFEIYTRVIEKYPDDAYLIQSGVDIKKELSLKDNLIDDYKKLIELEPNETLHYLDLAMYYDSLNDSKNAIKYAKKATELKIYDSFSHFTLGLIYQNASIFNEAIKSYNEAIKFFFDNIEDCYTKIAECYFELGNYLEAISFSKKSLETNLSNKKALCMLAKCYKITKNNDDFEKISDKIINLNTNDEFNNYDKGSFLYELEKYDEAIKCFEKSIYENIEVDFSNCYISICYSKKEDYEKALDYNERAINTIRSEYKDRITELYDNKARFLKKLGRYDEAKFMYKKVKDIEEKIGKVVCFDLYLKK